jgi:hypothetical protein
MKQLQFTKTHMFKKKNPGQIQKKKKEAEGTEGVRIGE